MAEGNDASSTADRGQTAGGETSADAAGSTDQVDAADRESTTDAETDPATDEDEGEMLSERAKAGIAIVALGVIVPGLVDNLLTQAGAPGLGVLVWTVGFGSAVIALWYVVLRPLDIGAETEA
ncbi:hypothetical protein ACFPYI_13610 [Halomarina salina]|uniref:AtpZ/AtpI family protein n=1 Tax=Halomarina salina TaxID=1872699 RepID=A0ABD5RP36_9EURY|nr:hypothetical protein [Halomarina salina]